VLKESNDDGIWKMVAVPSRAYHTPSTDKPLAGMRVSLKDNINLAGIKTTMTNRAYLELYGPERENAAFAEKLISLGAIIVGKTRMTSFASGEEPTDQWIDFHCPFNPRGDLYQSPGGSTTGGGASLAGYPWLDVSIGTDSRLPEIRN
jgi:Asp-tRNA(Asn)/Glu-tRNA(Gln) amidotransferase A subunit family amidase